MKEGEPAPPEGVAPSDLKSKRRGRRQTMRGNRPVDMLMAGGGTMPPGFTPGRKPGQKQPTVEQTFLKEQPKIPTVLPNGVEVNLTRNQRIILSMVLAGRTTSDIARAVGMTIPAVRSMLAGRTTAHVREAFRMLLEGSGIDAVAIVAKTHELLTATRAQWNPKDERWDHFPDYATQLGTWRPLIQLLGFMPARAQAAVGTGPAVVINTNFGGKDPSAPEAEGTFTVKVSRSAPPAVEGDADYDPQLEPGPIVDVKVEP